MQARNRRKRGLAALVWLGATLPAACAPAGPPPPRDDVVADSPHTLPYTALGLGLLREVGGRGPSGDAFVSPVSAGMALAMLYNGATANTQREIGAAIGAGDLPLEQVNEGNRALRAAARNGDVELAIANAVWTREGVSFSDEYLRRVREGYGAELAEVRFTDPATPERINRWVREATRGRIDGIVEAPMSDAVVLYVANAVYFKGRWADEFAKGDTRPRDFLLPDGTRAPRPTMHRQGSYRYLDGDGFRAVRLPYRGDRLAMYVFLPDSGASLASFRDGLTPARWDAWMTGFTPRDVALALPRFRATSRFNLVEPLRALGIRDLFDPGRASLRALLPASYAGPNVFVSDGVQATWIEVDEEGTEAAAATGLEVSVTSLPPPPIPFVVDRPFVAAVRDDRTGAILFIGQVNDPG